MKRAIDETCSHLKPGATKSHTAHGGQRHGQHHKGVRIYVVGRVSGLDWEWGREGEQLVGWKWECYLLEMRCCGKLPILTLLRFVFIAR